MHLVRREWCLHHAWVTRHLWPLTSAHHHIRVILLHLLHASARHHGLLVLLLLWCHATSLRHLLERGTHLRMSAIHSLVLTRLHGTHAVIHPVRSHAHRRMSHQWPTLAGMLHTCSPHAGMHLRVHLACGVHIWTWCRHVAHMCVGWHNTLWREAAMDLRHCGSIKVRVSATNHLTLASRRKVACCIKQQHAFSDGSGRGTGPVRPKLALARPRATSYEKRVMSQHERMCWSLRYGSDSDLQRKRVNFRAGGQMRLPLALFVTSRTGGTTMLLMLSSIQIFSDQSLPSLATCCAST